MKDNINNKRWREFIKLCTRASDANKLNALFNLFLTIEEKDDIGKRLEIINDLLSDKYSHRAIAEKVGVSISKITRGANCLKETPQDLLEFLKS
jgi:TrpR family trp operon transcriptional repressor